ncbi:hypothetical protein I6N90_02195 [Paenibacillus sp. GSMTC-2017]|uniref:hypothetical protein n=1 Tax=Paenibacillus sp. GSMTC-2017 TaxID=2794350 RepID=UPI0018D82431|nr:hypothetical protein [Paenibacillus sp. GSMTC-2017]MBH5316617.1 hypothetical protein [Paenibacillus sp. GSMTC-2017]
MLGTWRWNVAFGILGVGLTVLFSIGNNPLSVILLRSLYACIAFFVLGYLVRALLAFILRPPAIVGEPFHEQEEKGGQLDLTTPDESDDLNDLLKGQLQSGAQGTDREEMANSDESDQSFRPLTPPQFVSTNNKQPEDLAKAIRQLTGE